ncbi:MAG: hypothetical protein QY326_08195 [Bdellovibrionota bacterium]|nr:MAG: hypothetical protein QY326_08195 [Bdellovibrionota bacterium]
MSAVLSSRAVLCAVWSALVLGVSGLFSEPAGAEEWKFAVAPYVQIPWISGDASIGRIEEAAVDVGPDDILDTFSMGAMLQVEAQHSSGVGVILNYAFMDLSDSVSGPRDYVSADGDIYQGVLEGFASYTWNLETSELSLYGGARWYQINIDLSVDALERELDGDRDEGWVDPVIGLRFIPRLSDEWRLLLQGDVGGFDVSSDSSFVASGGFLWDVGESWSLVLLYKALWVDYGAANPGDSDRFLYDTVTHGPLLGAVFRF